MELIFLVIKKYDAIGELLASKANHLEKDRNSFKYWPNWQKLSYDIFDQIRKITSKFPRTGKLQEGEILELRTKDRRVFELMDKLFQRSMNITDFEEIYFRLGETFETFTNKRNEFYELLTELFNYCHSVDTAT